MTDNIIRMAREAMHERFSEGGYWINMEVKDLERFAALVAAEKDKEIKRLQDMLYEQLGELTALRADKQMRVHIEQQLKEQPR